MTWGPEDLAAELGAEANRDADGRLTEPYRLARSLCLFGAAAAARPRRSKQSTSISAISTALRRDTEEARRDGFSGRLAIHPAQVPVINEVFTPTAEALAQSAGDRRRLRRDPGCRRGRHRRQDV